MRLTLGAASLLLLGLGCAAKPSTAQRADQPAPALPAAPEKRGSVGVSRRASPAELSLVQTLMRETEALRGLRFRAPVEVTIDDARALRAYVDRALRDTQLQRAMRRYVALGALEPSVDIRALLLAVMDEELIGYYDPTEKRLAVRADIARALGAATASHERSLTWRATVVHELVHALQDQHFALGETIERERSTDEDNAFGALIEGDATFVMLAYTAQQAGETIATLAEHPEQILSAMTRSPDQLTGALRRAPALLREPLLFRYREGAYFCAQLYRAGGWARVDAAHRAPPRSTLSLTRVERYLQDQPEPTVALPSLDRLLAAGFAKLDEDVLGGLELSIMLGSVGAEADAILGAWRGDRYAVLQRAGQLASIWWLRLATPRSAKSVALAFTRLGDSTRRVVRRGNLLLVARGLDAATFAKEASTTPDLHTVSKANASPLVRGDPLATAGPRH